MLSKSLLMKSLSYSTSLSFVVLLSACGGSGGDNGNLVNDNTTNTSTDVKPNSNNSTNTGSTPVPYAIKTQFDQNMGSVTPSTLLVAKDKTAQFTIIPKAGYRIKSTLGCGGKLVNNRYTTAKINADCNVSVAFEKIIIPVVTYQINTSFEATQGTVSPSSVSVVKNASTNLLVTAKSGYKLDRVSGCGGTLSGNTFSIANVTSNCQVTATFAKIPAPVAQYTVSTNVDNAMGSVSPATQSVTKNSTTTLTVTPKTGYKTTQVTGCAGTLAGNTYTTGKLTANCQITAKFAKIPSIYQVSTKADSSMGSLSPATQSATENNTATLTVTPKAGYKTTQVTGCAGTLTGNTYTTGKLTANCQVTATFAKIPSIYQVSTKADSSMGSITPAKLSVEAGKTATVRITPKADYRIKSVSGCGGALSGNTYTTSGVRANCSINAIFEKKMSNVQRAFLKADHKLATADELIAYSQNSITAIETERKTLIDKLYKNVNVLSWYPTHDSVTFKSFAPERTFAVLNSTENHKGDASREGLIMAGTQGKHRYSAMGANLFTVNTNEQTHALLKNLLTWLTQKDVADKSQTLNVLTTHTADGYYFPHNKGIRTWLSTHLPNQHRINTANSCDYAALASCIDSQKPDLIIMGDTDKQGLGYAGVQRAIEKAKAQNIPLLFINHRRGASDMGKPVYAYMGLTATNNYWDKHQVKNLSASSLKQADATLSKVTQLLTNLKNNQFDTSVLDSCRSNYLYCYNTFFDNAFKTGANFYRDSAIGLDRAGIDVFAEKNNPQNATADTKVQQPLIKAALLLADKYRSNIDYPIDYSDTANWQKAMFADWVVSYARASNIAQPDLGEYVTDKKNVVKGKNAHYAYPKTVTQTKTFSVPYGGQWTTTGWYALPGQTIKVTRKDSSSAKVYIKFNYHRGNTNRAYQQKIYRGPLELSQGRISVNAGESITLSTPYGGPMYVYFEGDAKPLSTTLTMENVANHPSITDFSDEAQITRFDTLIKTTELPHVDLRTESYELHARRDRFTNAMGGNTPTVDILKSIQNDHINLVYTLAGFKVQGKTLQQSLPTAVKSICENLFGADCFDTQLHTRTRIQHANFDQNSQCGVGCSGNPWDSSYNISPTGWLDNHELGHNLQVNRLNVQYVSQAEKGLWRNYGSRAGENSNNIFPYYAKWHAHYIRDGKTTTLYDTHMNHKTVFYAFMSDVANIKDKNGNRVVLGDNCKIMDTGTSRYVAPWKNNSYAVHNGYRMGFYIQMALHADKTRFSDGTTVNNGFNIYPLLYLHQRIFGKYAKSEASWLANREKLGFGLFDYQNAAVYGNGRNVSHIPGNDFMLVSLSKLTGKDWRPYFDMFGLNYTDLASKQAVANTTKGKVEMGLYQLETDMPDAGISKNLNFLPLSLTNHKTLWKGKESPLQCSGF